jgi:hypothetical protein
MKRDAIEATQYPNTYAVAGELDASVMMAPQYEDTENDEEPPKEIGTLYWIGSNHDPTVGIFSSEVTPTFKSADELEAFCAKHRAEYDALADMDVWPPKLFWEK